MHSSWRQRPPAGWPLARIFPQPVQPRYRQSRFGQKCMEVSTWRRRPRVGTIRGGGAEETGRRGSVVCAQASQGGFWLRPAKGVGSRLRFGGGGAGVIGHVSAAAL